MSDDENTHTLEGRKVKVTVVRGKCIGAASCVAIAPGVFQLDEENKAIVVDPNGDTLEHILMAAQSCPTLAIELEDMETGEQLYP